MISWRNRLLLALLAGVLIQDIRLYSKIQSQETLSAYFLNVGQGDASFLHYGNRWILVDGGDRGGSQRLVAQSLRDFIRSQGITRIDLAVLSHAHADHLSG